MAVVGWGSACFPLGWRTERMLAGVTCSLAFASAFPRLLGLLGVCRPWPLFGGFIAFSTAGLALARLRGARPSSGPPAWALRGAAFWSLALIAAIATVVTFAAYYLPVWQYDSLTYHLPFVQFVLQDGTSRAVPDEIYYLGSYPHAVEWAFILFRAMLPDDRLVDLAQLPFGLAAAAATFGVARAMGARRPLAAVAAAAWLSMPAVFLQLPTDYIDVASAAFYLLAAFFLLRPPTAARLVLAALAAGLFLGTKPSAPLPFALLAAFAACRALRAGRPGAPALAAAGLCSAALGAESYVTNLALHHNPVWPVALDLGPLHLAGPVTLERVLSSGAGTERAAGPLASRVLASWVRLDAFPSFDMRVGGLNAVALVAVAAAGFWLARERRVGPAVLALGAALSPDPAVVRYVLALPAIALAACACAASSWRPSARAAASGVALSVAALSAALAARGLAGEGPALARYPSMTREEREVAVGAEGRPEAFVQMRGRLADGEAVGFDHSFELRYLVWRPDLSTRAVYLASGDDPSTQLDRIARERVRFVVVADGSPLVRAAGARFAPLFRCRLAPCAAYEVL